MGRKELVLINLAPASSPCLLTGLLALVLPSRCAPSLQVESIGGLSAENFAPRQEHRRQSGGIAASSFVLWLGMELPTRGIDPATSRLSEKTQGTLL